MGKLSKTKGKVGEREVANLLKDYGFEARRGQQYAGGGDSPDVVSSLPNTHLEVKRTERLTLYPALEQADGDRRDGETPVVVHRPSRKPWVAVLYFEDYLALMRKAYKGEEE